MICSPPLWLSYWSSLKPLIVNPHDFLAFSWNYLFPNSNWNKVRFESFLWGALAGCYVRPLSRIGRAMFFVASATSAPFSALCSVMYSEYSFLRAPEKKWSLWVAQKKATSHSVIIAVTITVSIGIMVTYHSSTAIKFLTTVLSLLSLKWVISTSLLSSASCWPLRCYTLG